jgi:hypothetical protein
MPGRTHPGIRHIQTIPTDDPAPIEESTPSGQVVKLVLKVRAFGVKIDLLKQHQVGISSFDRIPDGIEGGLEMGVGFWVIAVISFGPKAVGIADIPR